MAYLLKFPALYCADGRVLVVGARRGSDPPGWLLLLKRSGRNLLDSMCAVTIILPSSLCEHLAFEFNETAERHLEGDSVPEQH